MPRTHDGQALPVYSPDADIENADWTKNSWDFPPYKSAEFFDAIGGMEALDAFRTTPAYKAAAERGLIHDDEWVLDWCEPVLSDDDGEHDATDEHEPGKPRRGRVHVHVHRGR
jgi:hypothetical protein